jgi:AcrR family transcriptional regulator
MKGIRTFTQPRAAQTYLAILDAAARIFPRLGFEGTQTPDIAKEAGVSTGSVYRYFEDKRQIFLEMVEMELGKIRREVEVRLAALAQSSAAANPADALASLIDTLFDQIKKDAPLARVFTALALTDPDVAALKARTDAEDRDAVARLIEAAIPRATVKDPAATAVIVHAAAVGVATELALRKKRTRGPTDAEIKAALHEMLVGFFFGAQSAYPVGDSERTR